MNPRVFLSFDLMLGLGGLALIALLLISCSPMRPYQPPGELLWKTIQVGNPPILSPTVHASRPAS